MALDRCRLSSRQLLFVMSVVIPTVMNDFLWESKANGFHSFSVYYCSLIYYVGQQPVPPFRCPSVRLYVFVGVGGVWLYA